MNAGTGLTRMALKKRLAAREAGCGALEPDAARNSSALEDFFRTQLRRVRLVAGAHYTNVTRRRRQRRERELAELQVEVRGSCGSDVHMDVNDARALL